MEFNEFKKMFLQHSERMVENQSFLFMVDVDKDTLWNTYLNSFPEGTNQVYRKRREFDCSCCRQFIRTFGNVVAIKNNQVVSIWDFDTEDDKFNPVIKALANLVKSEIRDVFVTKQSAFGTDKSLEQLEDSSVHVWQHFSIKLPKQFLTRSNKSESALAAVYKDAKNVFKRSLDELSRDSIETVLDLIAESSLYKGDEWQAVLSQFLTLHNEYHNLADDEKDNYCWAKSVKVGGVISKIKNHSIGVLLQDITAGIDILEAIRRYEHIVAPTNYKRPKAIFTKRMVEQAQETITSLGLLNSLGRRHAKLSDITINNVLWANRDAQRPNGRLDVFDVLRQEVSVKPKSYERVQGISVETFISDILPTATSIEVLLENRNESNLVSLIAPKVADSSTLFKWDNAFSWAYKGNIADSMKQRVKAAGGNIKGILRFSLQWNDNFDNQNDYDAHCGEPDGNHIWFQNKGIRHLSSGVLDVDIIHPGKQVAVENITWTNINRMQEGVYTFYVHNYSHRGGRSGFDAEIEYAGQIYEFSYHKNLTQGEKVVVAKVKFDKRNGIKFIESLPTTTSSKKIWNLQTNQFHSISVCMFSPNFWDGQKGIGHKHYFLMLAGCENDTQPNGFFNEYLRQEFMEHKRVFAALGNKMKVDESENQLSGLGFSSTKRDSLIVRVDNKPIKIIF